MNKVILMGRLVRDPEVRYSQGANPLAVARYTLAVDRKFQKTNGEREADFIVCVAFGKSGEFAEKWFKKGQMVGVVGHLQVRNWDDNEGKKRWTTEVVVDEQYFCGAAKGTGGSNSPSQGAGSNNGAAAPAHGAQSSAEPHAAGFAGQTSASDGFYPIDENIEDDDLPF